jgi:hypothetical protein
LNPEYRLASGNEKGLAILAAEGEIRSADLALRLLIRNSEVDAAQ